MGLTAAIVLLLAAVDVRSSTLCPSADMVVARLLPLLASPETEARRHVVDLRLKAGPVEDSSVLHIGLIAQDGAEIGYRDIRASADCWTMAETVAAILATWEEGALLALPAVEASFASAPTVAVPGERTRGNHGYGELQLGAAVGSQVGSETTTDITLELDLGRPASWWQVRVGGMKQGDRRVEVHPGYAEFNHSLAFARLAWRSTAAVWPVSIDLGPSLGWATIKGHGYSLDQTQRSMELGLGVGLRTGRQLGRCQVWTELRTHAWPTRQRLMVRGGSASSELPTLDLSVSLGASCRAGR